MVYKTLLTPSPPFPLRGRETRRTSDCCSQCGGILPLSAYQSEAADRKGELEGVYYTSHMGGVESSG